ncbi:MAG: type II toxin-antitoxin system VapC family toxin [Candidatus Omnitrophica bacterium]|nr:type II toxin-antitoxin system VapC family toxin [Candidatus Omnitrophota bacterium]
MILVDSFGWIEFFTDGPLAGEYAKYLQRPSEVIVPTIVLYEVYKKIKNEKSEEAALIAVATMQNAQVVPLTEEISLSAADASLSHKLAMADAIVYASAIQQGAGLVTSDKDLKGLPHVTYFPKP